MSWAVGYDDRYQRWVGYGVPAHCDCPGCDRKIDRGLGYICGGDIRGSEHGCGLFFCGHHLYMTATKPQRCERCLKGEKPFEPTPDHTEWLEHQLSDESWQDWRDLNPSQVLEIIERLRKEKETNERLDTQRNEAREP